MPKNNLGRAGALLLAGIVALVTLPVMTLTVAAPAQAAVLPATVSADALPTVQINGVVWKQVIVGNTVYAGGQFTNARPAGAAPGVSTVARSNLLSYNLQTGVLINGFAPTFNGPVVDMAVTPDGSKLVVVGNFTQVNGVTRNRAAVFNLSNGSLSTTVVPNLNGVGKSVAATNSTIYLGGSFSTANGVGRQRMAAINATNGALLPFAVPVDDGQVQSIVVSPDATAVVLSGNFKSVGGSSEPGYGLARVKAGTGEMMTLPVNSVVRDAGNNSGIMRLASDSTSFYGVGWHYGAGGNSEGTFQASWADGSLTTLEDCHGDTYDVAPVGDVVYTASHKHYCANSGGFPQTEPRWTFWHSTAWTKSAQGINSADPYGYPDHPGTPSPALLPWFPQTTPGTFTGKSQAVWSVTGNKDYVVYGGEMTSVNGARQQGIVRYAMRPLAPNKQGPRTANGGSYVPSAKSYEIGKVKIAWPALWDRDDLDLTYQVFRGNTNTKVHETTQSAWQWSGKPMTFTDSGLQPGSTQRYAVRGIDPAGNQLTSGFVSVTVANQDLLGDYGRAVLQDGASKYWRLDEPAGDVVVNDFAGADNTTAGSTVTRGATGALNNNNNRASTFDGSASSVTVSSELVDGPQVFSQEVWFKTTSPSGKIAGFGSSASGDSGSYDRHIYLHEGRVHFGVWPGTERLVQSGPGYNDGQWHQVVTTLGSNGMALYVDGRVVGTRSDTTSAQGYTGYWRLGGDNVWSGADKYFNGSIDEYSIYPTALTPQQVNAHWVASGRTSTIPPAPADALGKAMYDSGPELYWRLNEANGVNTAADAAGSNVGTYTGDVERQRPGVVAGNAAARLKSTDWNAGGNVTAVTPTNNPTRFSQEVWIKTSTTTGGRIFGFGNSNNESQSSNYDRHLYMLDNGKVLFGVWKGETVILETDESLNDGAWHQIVTTFGDAGMRLYVDGQLNDTNPNTEAQDYTGYWKLGGDNAWGGNTDMYFTGDVDEAAVYGRALSASEVSAHFQAGTGVVTNVKPTAAFSSSSVGLKASFDAGASDDSDGTVDSYSWNFGDPNDATLGTGEKPDHTYGAAGTYTVQLTVTDNDGATDTISHDVTVAAANVKPTAEFSSSSVGLKASFDAGASDDTDGTVDSYSWNFGDPNDATLGTGEKPDHTYGAAGTYTVQLTVTDDDGATGTISHDVTVTAPATNILAADAFDRTVANGWGSADSGGPWTVRGGPANRFSVGASAGRMSIPAGSTLYSDLNQVSSEYTQVTAEFSVDKVADAVYVAVVGRQIGAESYVARLRLQADGQVRLYLLRNSNQIGANLLVPNLTVVPGEAYTLKFEVRGSGPATLSAKVWKSGQPEPAAWQLTGTHTLAALAGPGRVGVYGYAPAAAGTVLVSWPRVSVVDPR